MNNSSSSNNNNGKVSMSSPGAPTNDHEQHDRGVSVKTVEALNRPSAVGIDKEAREKSQLRQGAAAEEKSSLLCEDLDEQSRTKSAEIGEKSSSRQGNQKLMSSGVEEKSSLCPGPKKSATGGKTQRGKKAQVPSNQSSILSFMRPAQEAGEKSEPLTGCITAGKRPSLTEAVAENASESKRVKLIKEEPVEPTEHASVKTDEELEHTLHDIPEEAPFNPEDVDFILIEDDEYPEELKHEDAAGYDVEIDDSLPEQYHQEAGYLEEEGFVSDYARYRAAGIAWDEDYEALRQSFDKSMHRVIRYLWTYAQNTPFKELSGPESWIARGMYNWLRKADPEVVYRLYQAIIPESTRTILGHDRLTGQHILALPKVSPSRRRKGVYLDYVSSPREEGGLYTGSTKACLSGRITAHRREIQRNGSVTGGHYRYIREKTDRKPHFRVVAVFPRNVSELGIKNADSEELIRFLETVIMIVLDTFTPGSLAQFSVPQDRLDDLRSECGLKPTVFYPLNRALPTKQSVRSNIPRVCGNCSSDQSSSWFLGYNASTLVAFCLCSACYQWQRTHGTDRPASIYNRIGEPTSGPCSNPNCHATETSCKWYRNPKDRDQVLCAACFTYQNANNGKERPLETIRKHQKDQRRCIDCDKSGPGVIWLRATDQPTPGLHRCHACYNRYQRSLPKPREQSTQSRRCATCGKLDPKEWHEKSSMCGSCHDKDQEWREKRERSNCWNCREQFTEEMKKRWSSSLREWLCNKCGLSLNVGYLRMAAHHLENLDIRCELCRTKYSKAWYAGCKSTSAFVCRPCGDTKERDPNRTNFGDRFNRERGYNELTYQEARREKKNTTLKREFFDYLKRVHGIDRSAAAMAESKRLEDAQDLEG